MMESIIRDGMVEHLTQNSLTHSSQHGFIENKSCLTNLLEFLESVTEEFDEGKPMDLIYDLSGLF